MSTTKKDDYYHVGLTDDEVLQSREKNGVNLLTPPKRPSLWKLYLEKFEDPVVRVLLVAAVFSLIISIIENEYAETIGTANSQFHNHLTIKRADCLQAQVYLSSE